MKIIIHEGDQRGEFHGTVAEMIERLDLRNRHYLMYTLTSVPHRYAVGHQFRAWTTPFANFDKDHVDTGSDGSKVFEILGNPEEILLAVEPLIKGKSEWEPVRGYSGVRLWLSWDKTAIF